MLWNGEFYYYLSRSGAALLTNSEGMVVPTRACAPIGLSVQAHEFEISRFWIKFFHDCRKLSIPVLDFHRDGQTIFRVDGKRLIPDGFVILRIRGKARAFFLELDRSTQTSGIGGNQKAIIRQKLLGYQTLSRSWRSSPELNGFEINSIRTIFVCLNDSRLENLRQVASALGLRKQCAFTCLPRFLGVTDPNLSKGWSYRRANLLAAPVFTFPIRPPPASLLS